MCKIYLAVTLIIIFLFFPFDQNAFAAGVWTPQNSGVTDDLFGIDFIDTLNGWCVGAYSYILHTTDGGQNWGIQHQSAGPSCIFAIDMVDADTGYAAGGYDWSWGWIYKTTDGGNTWDGTQVLPEQGISDIFFIGTKRGWATGGGMAYSVSWDTTWFWQYILKTTDGGGNWSIVLADSSINNPAKGELSGISFADTMHGIAVGVAGSIFTTDDGGQNWTRRSGVTNRTIFDVTHIKDQTYIAVGDTGLILRTTNGGATWDTCARDSVATLRAVDFADSSYGWIVGRPVSGLDIRGIILNSTNSGNNWYYQNTGINCRFYDVKCVNKNFSWACGGGGKIYRYYDPTGVEGEPIQNPKSKISKHIQIHFLPKLTLHIIQRL